nr:hypothetical protein [Tanacetum cinerariifolium]
PRSTIDDEYANANERDPKILITTSKDPSGPLKQFVKELTLVFPNSDKMNRGGQVMSEIVASCRSHDFTDVIFVNEVRGIPNGMIISHLPFGPTAYFHLHDVVTRHDNKDKELKTVSQAYPHLILNNFSTKTLRNTIYVFYILQSGGPKSVELKEVGPRFLLRLYKIKLGTIDQAEAQDEWVLRNFINTSKKQKVMGE